MIEDIAKFWKVREGTIDRNKMELKLMLREEEAEFDKQNKNIKLWENAVADKEQQERICPKYGHRRLCIETQRKGFVESWEVWWTKELGKHMGASKMQFPSHTTM